MCALYAVARRIDDIGDGTAPTADKLAALAAARKQLAAIAADPATAGDDPVLVALADAARRYPIPDERPRRADRRVRDGRRRGTTYETFDDLVGYCRRVAGTVGRLSLGVYGSRRSGRRPSPLADALGVALQITNILRDIVEDRDTMGRVYLPGRGPRPLRRRPRPAGPDGRRGGRSSPSRRPGPRRGTTEGLDAAAACSTGAPGRARPPWPASTAGSWSASSADPAGGAARPAVAPGVGEGRRWRSGP